MILTRSTSLSQPPGLTDIDWSHPLAKGLKYCLSAAGGPVDDVSRKGAALEVGASVVPTRHGIGLRGTQGGTGAAGFKVAEGGFSKLVPVTSPFTVFTRIYVREIGKNLIILADYSSSASPHTISIAIETNTNNTLSAYFAVGGVQTGVTGGTLSIGWHDVAFRYDGSRYSLALNGAQVAQVGNSSPRNAGTDFRALRGGAYPTAGFSGDMIALSIHARALSDDELVRLRANPWQLFKPVQRRIYFGMGAGGGGTTHTVTADPVDQGSTTTRPGLTQTHVTTASAVAQGATVGRPAVTQTHVVEARPNLQAGIVARPLVTQTHVVTARAVAQGSTVNAPAVEVGSITVVTARPVVQSGTVNAPSIVQTHIVTARPVAHSSTVTRPGLTQTHTVTARAVTQGSVVNAPSVDVGSTPATVVTALPVAQGSTVNAPGLVQTHVTSARAVVQGSTINVPGLVQTHAVTARAVVQASTVRVAGIAPPFVRSIYWASVPSEKFSAAVPSEKFSAAVPGGNQ